MNRERAETRLRQPTGPNCAHGPVRDAPSDLEGSYPATVACLPFAGQLVSQLGSAPVGDTLNVVYLGLFPTMLGFTTWAYALARTPSGKMGATTYAVPGLVVLMSWLILGQVPRWLTIAGGVLCLAGVAVSRSRSVRRATPGMQVAATAEGQPR